ncbi:hypothetical protein HK099_004964 [Clydaea vesicula]|uniref:Pentatricopeptide repeat-containing protein n=1 Tax=Clydaea vesicula TaxID=447962 RepID=A0AAD5U292_9FUNG|nr:hypothetical protein HK099_004964 [Clydaea vesicula]
MKSNRLHATTSFKFKKYELLLKIVLNLPFTINSSCDNIEKKDQNENFAYNTEILTNDTSHRKVKEKIENQQKIQFKSSDLLLGQEKKLDIASYLFIYSVEQLCSDMKYSLALELLFSICTNYHLNTQYYEYFCAILKKSFIRKKFDCRKQRYTGYTDKHVDITIHSALKKLLKHIDTLNINISKNTIDDLSFLCMKLKDYNSLTSLFDYVMELVYIGKENGRTKLENEWQDQFNGKFSSKSLSYFIFANVNIKSDFNSINFSVISTILEQANSRFELMRRMRRLIPNLTEKVLSKLIFLYLKKKNIMILSEILKFAILKLFTKNFTNTFTSLLTKMLPPDFTLLFKNVGYFCCNFVFERENLSDTSLLAANQVKLCCETLIMFANVIFEKKILLTVEGFGMFSQILSVINKENRYLDFYLGSNLLSNNSFSMWSKHLFATKNFSGISTLCKYMQKNDFYFGDLENSELVVKLYCQAKDIARLDEITTFLLNFEKPMNLKLYFVLIHNYTNSEKFDIAFRILCHLKEFSKVSKFETHFMILLMRKVPTFHRCSRVLLSVVNQHSSSFLLCLYVLMQNFKDASMEQYFSLYCSLESTIVDQKLFDMMLSKVKRYQDDMESKEGSQLFTLYPKITKKLYHIFTYLNKQRSFNGITINEKGNLIFTEFFFCYGQFHDVVSIASSYKNSSSICDNLFNLLQEAIKKKKNFKALRLILKIEKFNWIIPSNLLEDFAKNLSSVHLNKNFNLIHAHFKELKQVISILRSKEKTLLKEISIISGKLINLYLKQHCTGYIDFSNEILFLYKNIPQKNLITIPYNFISIILDVFARKESLEASEYILLNDLKLLDLKPNEKLFTRILQICKSMKRNDRFNFWLSKMEDFNIKADVHILSIIAKDSFDTGNLTKATEILKIVTLNPTFIELDVLFFNILILGFMKENLFDLARETLDQMLKLDIFPDKYTILAMTVNIHKRGDVVYCLQVFNELFKKNKIYFNDHVFCNFFINFAKVLGSIEPTVLDRSQSVKIIEGILEKMFDLGIPGDFKTWTSIMVNYMIVGDFKQAARCWEQLKLPPTLRQRFANNSILIYYSEKLQLQNHEKFRHLLELPSNKTIDVKPLYVLIKCFRQEFTAKLHSQSSVFNKFSGDVLQYYITDHFEKNFNDDNLVIDKYKHQGKNLKQVEDENLLLNLYYLLNEVELCCKIGVILDTLTWHTLFKTLSNLNLGYFSVQLLVNLIEDFENEFYRLKDLMLKRQQYMSCKEKFFKGEANFETGLLDSKEFFKVEEDIFEFNYRFFNFLNSFEKFDNSCLNIILGNLVANVKKKTEENNFSSFEEDSLASIDFLKSTKTLFTSLKKFDAFLKFNKIKKFSPKESFITSSGKKLKNSNFFTSSDFFIMDNEIATASEDGINSDEHYEYYTVADDLLLTIRNVEKTI